MLGRQRNMPLRSPDQVRERDRRDILARYVTSGRKAEADVLVKQWNGAQNELNKAEDDIAKANCSLAEMGIHWYEGCDGDEWTNGLASENVYRYSLNQFEDFIAGIRQDVFNNDTNVIKSMKAERNLTRDEDEAVFLIESTYESQKALFELAWSVAKAQARKFSAQMVHNRFMDLIRRGKEEEARKESALMGDQLMRTPRKFPMIKMNIPAQAHHGCSHPQLPPSPDRDDIPCESFQNMSVAEQEQNEDDFDELISFAHNNI